MKEQSLALSFSNSLTIDVASIASEYAELGLDALVEEGILKDIPLVSTAVAVYRIGKSIHERHHVAKLTSFLAGINEGIVDEEQRQKYRQTFSGNEKFRNQELEYILILIDRYIGFDKPQMLAKLYHTHRLVNSNLMKCNPHFCKCEVSTYRLPDMIKIPLFFRSCS
ncbi:MAG: hypothetical protein IKV99_08040 [Oscillospiraceae bacterium]|nr:hypothetical protein [Oscillospiraceae bacterium]